MTTIFLLISVCHMSADAEWSNPPERPGIFFSTGENSDGLRNKDVIMIDDR